MTKSKTDKYYEIYDYHSDFDCEADYDIAYNTKRDDISVVVK